jgi:hypothetical protein
MEGFSRWSAVFGSEESDLEEKSGSYSLPVVLAADTWI